MRTQRTLLRYGLAVLAVAACLAGSNPAGAADPTLAQFGYTNMSARFSQPLLVVLANFTNNNVAFLTNGVSIGTNYAAATNYHANWFFNPAYRPGNFSEYFRETSNGRFSWTRGGVLMALLNVQNNFASYAPAGDKQTLLFSSNIVWRALRTGQFNFRDYDNKPRDGVVTAVELTVVVISNDPTFAGAGVRWPGEVAGTNVNWRGAVALCQSDQGIGVIGHEMVHLLQEFNGVPGFDIYGERCLSDGLTIMGCATERLYVDAWHKLQFGWIEPRLVPLHDGGRFVIPAAQSLDPTAPLLLYDPSGPNGLREYFLVEYRTADYLGGTTHYDRNVAGSGMVVWHVSQTSTKAPRDYVGAAMPSAESGWSMCRHCRVLFHAGTSAGRCASTNSVHASNPDEADHIFVLAKNDATAQGIPLWTRCTKCQSLYYSPNGATSVCPDGGRHSAASGNYRVPVEGDTDTVGRRDFFECNKCRALYRNTGSAAERVCPNGGSHAHDAGGPFYGVTTTGARAMMSEGAPDFIRGGSQVWDSGTETPHLRWYADGETAVPVRLRVLPFAAGAESITVEILRDTDTWVDFAYGGTERGTFDQPFNTLVEGVNQAGYGGTVKIKSGVSAERAHVTGHRLLRAYGGPVTIGR